MSSYWFVSETKEPTNTQTEGLGVLTGPPAVPVELDRDRLGRQRKVLVLTMMNSAGTSLLVIY